MVRCVNPEGTLSHGGKKTINFELTEQFGWILPDLIIYSMGNGTGLIGMWKAFDELELWGWIDDKRPRMVTVQTEGCTLIPKPFTLVLPLPARVKMPIL